MIDKVWVVKREEMEGYDKIMDEKVYLSKDTAEQIAEDYNKGSIYKYYVDYLDFAE